MTAPGQHLDGLVAGGNLGPDRGCGAGALVQSDHHGGAPQDEALPAARSGRSSIPQDAACQKVTAPARCYVIIRDTTASFAKFFKSIACAEVRELGHLNEAYALFGHDRNALQSLLHCTLAFSKPRNESGHAYARGLSRLESAVPLPRRRFKSQDNR